MLSHPRTRTRRQRSCTTSAAAALASSVDAAIERGEVKQLRDGKGQVFQLGIQKISVAEVDRWRKLAAMAAAIKLIVDRRKRHRLRPMAS